MGGILKNPLPEGQNPENEESVSEFRKQVYKNTQLNAKLTSKSRSDKLKAVPSVGISNPPKHAISLKHQQDETLKWNQKNLRANEKTKEQFQDIKIDEPKTPYQGAVDPSGEYYKPDDEDELNNFSLGEPEVSLQDEPKPSPDLLQNDDQRNPSSSPRPLTEEEARHKKFEEMRKKHYNVGAALRNRRLHAEDEDDDDEQNN